MTHESPTSEELMQLARLAHERGWVVTAKQLHEINAGVEDALAQRFQLGELSVSDRARVRDIIRDRICGSLSLSGGSNALNRHMLKPAFFDQEALLAIQLVLQQSTLQKSRELLSAAKSGFQRLIVTINSFFAELEATEHRLVIATTAGKHHPRPYKPTNIETPIARLSRLSRLIDERGWRISADALNTIERGIIRVLAERYPNSLESDFMPIIEVIRDRAVALLQENDGKWPRRKGNWYADQIDELLTTHNDLFALVLTRN